MDSTSNQSRSTGATGPIRRFVHRSPLQEGKTFHGHTILATTTDPAFKDIIRIKTNGNKIMYAINVRGSLEDGFQRQVNGHLLDDLPPVANEDEKCFWLERHDGEDSAFKPCTAGTPKICDQVPYNNVGNPVPVYDYISFEKVPSRVPSAQRNLGRWTERACVVTHPYVEGKMAMRIVEFPECLHDHPLTKLEEDRLSGNAITLMLNPEPRIEPTQSQRIFQEIEIYILMSTFFIAPEMVGLVMEEGRGIIGQRWTGEEEANADICEALQLVARMHESGIIHGDLRSASIVKQTDESMYIIDFETAYYLGKGDLSDEEEDVVKQKEYSEFSGVLTQLLTAAMNRW
ncbi:hypothetical protein BKA67DRAFT_664835 [Truncatella angustata]|uniref:Protein kinase domain-containing protein n=1 Tax=Truncatella angustata TaxID=152316 RepID=A0A9P8RIZ3_9PEZI|nr:uncharacterized protein BKA67DRAFT_664835 [Truncatella angustata]KAH6644986.1 hypothetical protein BKA67DRAFT_664835 [Truncatella angustata]